MSALNTNASEAFPAPFLFPNPIRSHEGGASRPELGTGIILGAKGSLDDRSHLLGKAIVRRFAVDPCHPLLFAKRIGREDDVTGETFPDHPCVARLEQLITGACIPDSTEASPSSRADNVFASWLGSVLQWACKHTASWDAAIREACLLKPLAPLYQSCASTCLSSDSLRANALDKTRQLALELIGLVELYRSLEHVGFAKWLPQKAEGNADLFLSAQESLQVDFVQLARAIQNQLLCNCETEQQPRFSEVPIAPSEQLQWWSMAWQWSRAQTAFLAPSDGLDAEVAWERWISHWKELSCLLQGEPSDSQQRWVVLRRFREETYAARLNRILEDVRAEQGTLTLVTLRYLGNPSSHPSATEAIAWWQTEWLKSTNVAFRDGAPEGFVHDSGELVLLFRNRDRSEMSQIVRDGLAQMQMQFVALGLLDPGQSIPIITGIASVDRPARSFRIGQLLDAANRCLANAASQGPGTVKSIEVF